MDWAPPFYDPNGAVNGRRTIYVSIVPLPRNPCDREPRVRFGCRTKHAAGDDEAGMDGVDG